MNVVLHILYINSLLYVKIKRDPRLCPVVLWDAKEIRRFIKWLNKQVGIGIDKVWFMVKTLTVK